MNIEEWHESNLAVQRQARDAEVARYREWRERTEKKLRAKRPLPAAAAQTKTPPPPADSSLGWRVLETPRASHAALEEHARAVCSFTWHQADWPTSWRVRWGRLDSALLSVSGNQFGHCAARGGREVLGLCVMSSKIILLDEENQQGRSARQFGTTIIHELCHVQVRSTIHGPQFQQALESATSYVLDSATAPAPPRFMANAAGWSGPTIWPGARFRPGRDPGLEDRG
jgi:hypothetical protein